MGAHGGTCVKLLSRTWRTTACSSVVPALIRRGSLLHPASEDAGFSGCSSRHRCTASIWHRRYALPPVAHRAVMPIASAARVPAPTCAHVAPEAARGSGGHRSSSLAGAVTGARIYGDVDGITTMPRPHATPPPNGAAESQGAHAGTPNQAGRTGRPAHADTSPPASAAPPAGAARGPDAPMSGELTPSPPPHDQTWAGNAPAGAIRRSSAGRNRRCWGQTAGSFLRSLSLRRPTRRYANARTLARDPPFRG
jgi:hypothetical protein